MPFDSRKVKFQWYAAENSNFWWLGTPVLCHFSRVAVLACAYIAKLTHSGTIGIILSDLLHLGAGTLCRISSRHRLSVIRFANELLQGSKILHILALVVRRTAIIFLINANIILWSRNCVVSYLQACIYDI